MNLLLEIGCEEIPDWMLSGALEYLSGAIGSLAGVTPRTDATPRRLVVRAEGLLEREPDTEERVQGPSKNAPPQAVAGFAKKQGLTPEQLEIVSDKYSYVRHTAGRPTIDILAAALPALILKTPFPKTMYWPGKGGPRFVRPIRWIVALLDTQVIPFEIAGVNTGNQSSGHRKLGASRFPVTYETYEQSLRDNFVILSAEERKKRIRAVPTKYKCDNDLLNTLVNLTEWPTPFTGTFDEEFLTLPKEVLITVMRYHQKYFSVESKDGKLVNQFVAVTNTDGDPEGLIRLGNERVVRARFNDARFFWDADQKKSLANRGEDLSHVTFQAKLGTYLDKTKRVEELVRELEGTKMPSRAAHLCKADLTTELVKELTELQGIIGGLYAEAQGKPERSSPRHLRSLPPGRNGRRDPRNRARPTPLDRRQTDTLRGCFEVGLIPTGSKDPFGLRRAAQGIVRVIVEGGLRDTRISGASAELPGILPRPNPLLLPAKSKPPLRRSQRSPGLRPRRPRRRSRPPRSHPNSPPTPNFEPVAAAFKRIRNILKQAGDVVPGPINSALFRTRPRNRTPQKPSKENKPRPHRPIAKNSNR